MADAELSDGEKAALRREWERGRVTAIYEHGPGECRSCDFVRQLEMEELDTDGPDPLYGLSPLERARTLLRTAFDFLPRAGVYLVEEGQGVVDGQIFRVADARRVVTGDGGTELWYRTEPIRDKRQRRRHLGRAARSHLSD